MDDPSGAAEVLLSLTIDLFTNASDISQLARMVTVHLPPLLGSDECSLFTLDQVLPAPKPHPIGGRGNGLRRPVATLPAAYPSPQSLL